MSIIEGCAAARPPLTVTGLPAGWQWWDTGHDAPPSGWWLDRGSGLVSRWDAPPPAHLVCHDPAGRTDGDRQPGRFGGPAAHGDQRLAMASMLGRLRDARAIRAGRPWLDAHMQAQDLARRLDQNLARR